MKSYGSATPHQNGDATRDNHLSRRMPTQIDFLMGSLWVRFDGLDLIIFDSFKHLLHVSMDVRLALRVLPAVIWLAVYRWLHIMRPGKEQPRWEVNIYIYIYIYGKRVLQT